MNSQDHSVLCEAELFARCLLLFARCSLFFAHCSLLFARCLLLFACCSLSFRPNYCEIKLLWTAKKWFDNNETPPHIFSLQIFSTYKTIFKVDINSQILPELISLWRLYCKIWTRFYLLLCTWRVKSSRHEEFSKKDVLKVSGNP